MKNESNISSDIYEHEEDTNNTELSGDIYSGEEESSNNSMQSADYHTSEELIDDTHRTTSIDNNEHPITDDLFLNNRNTDSEVQKGSDSHCGLDPSNIARFQDKVEANTGTD